MITAKGSLNGRPLRLVEAGSEADVTIALVPPAAKAINPLAQRFYAVVAPFATVRDDIPLAELQARWQGKGEGLLYASQAVADDLAPILGPFAGATLTDQELRGHVGGRRGCGWRVTL